MPEPPRWAEWLLLRLVGGRDGEAIAGDLREAWNERGGGWWWYWWQVLSSLLVRLSPHRRMVPDLRADLHHALRILRRNPGYALTAMLCLALGIGVNTTVFSLVDSIFFRRLPVPDADQMVSIDRDGRGACSWREYRALATATRSLAGMAAVIPKETFVDIASVNEQIFVETVSANYADVLRTSAVAGRWFVAGDEVAGAEPVAVISERLWARHFGRRTDVSGAALRIENQWYRVIGVARGDYDGVSAPLRVDAWVPLATYPHYRVQVAGGAAGPDVQLIGRRAPRASLAMLRAEIAVAGARMEKRPGRVNPLAVREIAGFTSAETRRSLRPLGLMLSAVVAIILLIACVNVASLLFARAEVRRREMAVRLSLGATRGRLIRQGLTEGVTLAAGGALMGVVLSIWTNHALLAWLPVSLPSAALRTIGLEWNLHVAVFTGVVAMVSAILFSLAPAMESARSDLTMGMKGAGAGTGGSRRRDVYVVVQVALSLVLLVGAVLLLRGLSRAATLDPGYAVDHRLYVRLFTPEPDFTPASSMRLFSRLVEEARTLPGVRDATLSFAVLGFTDSECARAERSGPSRRLNLNVVEPNYFRVMRVPVLRGRSFEATDRPETRRAVVVNETLAKRWFDGQDPIGRSLWFGCEGTATEGEIVGVARDTRVESLDESPRPMFYFSARQVWWNGFFALIVHTEGAPDSMAADLLNLARGGGPAVRIYETRSLEATVALSLWNVRFYATLLGAFSVLAVVLSALGLYGVVAYSVAQRTREIGLRMAVGAHRRDVQWMVLGGALRLAATGVLAGALLSAGVTRFLRGFLYGVDPLDPAAFVAAALVWIVIAMLASYVPSLRATRVDPLVALRWE